MLSASLVEEMSSRKQVRAWAVAKLFLLAFVPGELLDLEDSLCLPLVLYLYFLSNKTLLLYQLALKDGFSLLMFFFFLLETVEVGFRGCGHGERYTPDCFKAGGNCIGITVLNCSFIQVLPTKPCGKLHLGMGIKEIN